MQMHCRRVWKMGWQKGRWLWKGKFYNVCKDHVQIGGERKTLTELHTAIKVKIGHTEKGTNGEKILT